MLRVNLCALELKSLQASSTYFNGFPPAKVIHINA